MDERQKLNSVKPLAITVAVTYIYLLVETFYKFISTKDIFNCTWEIGLLVLMPIIICVVLRSEKEVMIPNTLSGKEIDKNMTPKAKSNRKRSYLFDSILFAGGLTAASIAAYCFGVKDAIDIYLIPNLSESASMMVSFFLEFTGLFIVSYLVDYIWGEHSVKQYNKIINEFDD